MAVMDFLGCFDFPSTLAGPPCFCFASPKKECPEAAVRLGARGSKDGTAKRRVQAVSARQLDVRTTLINTAWEMRRRGNMTGPTASYVSMHGGTYGQRHGVRRQWKEGLSERASGRASSSWVGARAWVEGRGSRSSGERSGDKRRCAVRRTSLL